MTSSADSPKLVWSKLKEMKYDILAETVLDATTEYLYCVCINCDSINLVVSLLPEKTSSL